MILILKNVLKNKVDVNDLNLHHVESESKSIKDILINELHISIFAK